MDNNELKERFIDEKTGIEYIKKCDYYFPYLVDSASVKANELGKYGKLSATKTPVPFVSFC